MEILCRFRFSKQIKSTKILINHKTCHEWTLPNHSDYGWLLDPLLAPNSVQNQRVRYRNLQHLKILTFQSNTLFCSQPVLNSGLCLKLYNQHSSSPIQQLPCRNAQLSGFGLDLSAKYWYSFENTRNFDRDGIACWAVLREIMWDFSGRNNQKSWS